MKLRVKWDNNNLQSLSQKRYMSSEEKLLYLNPEVFGEGILVGTTQIGTNHYAYGIILDQNNEFKEIKLDRLIYINDEDEDEDNDTWAEP